MIDAELTVIERQLSQPSNRGGMYGGGMYGGGGFGASMEELDKLKKERAEKQVWIHTQSIYLAGCSQ